MTNGDAASTVAPEDDVAADEPALPTADAALAALNV
jgi:hypothetical protein